MQTLLLPAARSGLAPPPPPFKAAVSSNASRHFLRFNTSPFPHSSLSSLKFLQSLSPPYTILNNHTAKTLASASAPTPTPTAAAYTSPSDESEKAKLAQVSLSLSPFLCVTMRITIFFFFV